MREASLVGASKEHPSYEGTSEASLVWASKELLSYEGPSEASPGGGSWGFPPGREAHRKEYSSIFLVKKQEHKKNNIKKQQKKQHKRPLLGSFVNICLRMTSFLGEIPQTPRARFARNLLSIVFCLGIRSCSGEADPRSLARFTLPIADANKKNPPPALSHRLIAKT
jgi:hypothetical protein